MQWLLLLLLLLRVLVRLGLRFRHGRPAAVDSQGELLRLHVRHLHHPNAHGRGARRRDVKLEVQHAGPGSGVVAPTTTTTTMATATVAAVAAGVALVGEDSDGLDLVQVVAGVLLMMAHWRRRRRLEI